MKIAFYRAIRPYQRLIAFITRPGQYCHCELVFDRFTGKLPITMGGVVIPVLEHDPGGSLCFSSSEQDGGTRFKTIDLTDGKWDVVDVPIKSLAAFKWAVAHLNVQYDWAGLRGFVFPWDKADPKDLFCSECAVECMQDQGFYADLVAGKTSPNALARAVGLLPPK